MKKKEIPFDPNPSAKDHLLALAHSPIYTKLLDATGKSYQLIHNWLLENEKRLMDNNSSLPSIKEIAKETLIAITKVPKYLNDIYTDILQLNTDQPYKFVGDSQTLCYMTFEYLGLYTSFNLGLSVIPRVGEHFEIRFMKPKSGGGYFVVQRIYNEIENGKQTISISMTTEQPIQYLQLLKDKAYLNKWISHMEYLKPTDSLLQERLLSRYKEL
jgi:hypothetical protein